MNNKNDNYFAMLTFYTYLSPFYSCLRASHLRVMVDNTGHIASEQFYHPTNVDQPQND